MQPASLPDRFRQGIARPDFPCVGAKSALARDAMQLATAGDLRDAAFDASIVRDLQAFAAANPDDALFVSHACLFPETPALDEAAFEAALWSRLRALSAIDARTFDWDARVSSDPASPDFSMSFGGRAFYVIGLHPNASRPARRFDCATLVFNLHSQFETLRAQDRYEKLREAIVQRDITLSGSANPMLARHGVTSEARQYSGRDVGADWTCPHAFGGARDVH